MDGLMQNRTMRIAMAVLVVASVGLLAWSRLASSPASLPASPVASPRVTALDALAAQNRARLAALRIQLAIAPPVAGDARYPAALVTEVARELGVLGGARKMFDRDALIRDELSRLARDPAHVALAVELASDWQLATRLFGKQQAEARVYAQAMLRYLAETGAQQHVARAVDRIGAQLNAEGPWTKGIEYDYVDALAVYLRSVGTQQFLADAASYYAQMHLTERTSLEVQRAVYDSGILKDASPETLAQVRQQFWAFLGKEPPRGG